MNEILEKTYSVSEAAKILDVHRLTVQRYMTNKKIGYYRFGGKNKIGESHLRNYIAQAEVKAANNGRG